MTAPTYRLTSVWPRRAERIVRRPYIALAGLQVLDVLTTGVILGVFVGAGREGNPVAATLFEHAGLMVGLAVMLVAKLATVSVLWWAQFPPRLPNAIYGMVVFNNALILALAVWAALR